MNIPICRDACWRSIALQKFPARPVPLSSRNASTQQRFAILPITKWNLFRCPIHLRPNRQPWQPIERAHLPMEQAVGQRKTINPYQRYLHPFGFHRPRTERMPVHTIGERHCDGLQATYLATFSGKDISVLFPLIKPFQALLGLNTTDLFTAGEGA